MILDRFRLTGRVAVVTGAGRGIGAATALALAEAGADVVISARTVEQLAEVAGRIEAAGRKAVVVPADLNDLDAVAALAPAAQEAFGRLDIVVNNVGGTMPRGFLETSPRFMEQAFHFNVATAHALTRAAVPLMLAGGDGAVVNISSAMGRTQARGFVAYGTAKAALAHYTRLAATDLAPRIRVNAIAVGSVATSALEVVLTDDSLRTTMEDATPLRRIGEPEDIAAAIVYLCSPAGGYVTGKVVEVDGGLSHPNLDMGLPDL
jgi:7-alpha-hydroxysteroid dehydrogenase